MSTRRALFDLICDGVGMRCFSTSENTNRLLRHWFTKGTDLSVHTQADVRRIQNLLNFRA